MKPIRVLLVDDRPLLRAGLRLLVESRPELAVAGEAAQPAEACAVATREQPDIILLGLPLGDGQSDSHDADALASLFADLLAVAPQARIIVLTGLHDRQLHRHVVALGAMGLVQHRQTPAALFKAIACVHAGEVWLERSLIAGILTQMARPAAQGDPAVAKIQTLTARERDIIRLIGEGLKNKQIAERLFITETTVRNHLGSIFSKLGVSDRLELAVYAYRHSLIGPSR